MKAKLSYKEQIEDMHKAVSQLQTRSDEEIKPVLRKIGQAISKNVKSLVPVSDKEFDYKNGMRVTHVHLKDDVVYKVKKSRNTDEQYVSVSGGKSTGSLWHLVNDGHTAQDGTWVNGTFFVDMAELKSTQEVDAIVDTFLKGVVED